MNKVIIVGIAGGSASGKSTFSKKVVRKLQEKKVLEIHMDSYFKSPEERPIVIAPITGKEYRDDNHPSSFDLPKLKQDLREAVAGEQYQVVIIEGLLTLWDKEIYDQLDLRLYMDCQADERITRRLRRNMTWGLSFDEIANVYLDMVRYRHDEYVEPSKWRADLIINGSMLSERAVDAVVNYIQSML